MRLEIYSSQPGISHLIFELKRQITRNDEGKMKYLSITVPLLITVLLFNILAQCATLPDAPAPKNQIVAANSVNLAASGFVAGATWYGAHQCIVREELKRSPKRSFWKAILIQAPLDVAVTAASGELRRSHPSLSLALPVIATGVKLGVGSALLSAGC